MSIGVLVAGLTGPIAGVQQVEVLESLGQPTRYRIRIAADIDDGDIPALADGAIDPGSLLVVMTAGESLVRGPVTGQRAFLSGVGEGSYVDILGGDRLLELDKEERLESWSLMRASDVVSMLTLTRGMLADVESTGTTYGPTTHDLIQRGTDLDFLQQLARRNGMLLWLTANALGIETVHFKKPPVTDSPAAVLSIHLPLSAFDQLSIAWDADRPTSVTAAGLDVGNLSTVDASVQQSPLGAMASKRLATIADGPRTALALAPGDDAAAMTGTGDSLLMDADLFVTATATTNLSRVGQPLHAHTVVKLDGLGSRHSGTWLVSQVRHLIDATTHRMECTFLRNGWEG